MSVNNDAVALARREPTISKSDYDAISKAARAELRDRFAIGALTGLLASPSDCQGTSKNPLERFSERAYEYADAMMKARGHE